MSGIAPGIVSGRAIDDEFVSAFADFSIKLACENSESKSNQLISPLSAMLALSMTANGAGTNTLSQMEKVLCGGITIDSINEYLHSYVSKLPSSDESKLHFANSIWFRNDESRLLVEGQFLQTNADFYGADAFKSPFDSSTIKDINKWVDKKTDGLIDKIIDEIPDDTVMYLINALTFDARWLTTYTKPDISNSKFRNADGTTGNVKMMNSTEHTYISDDMSTGFIKPYAGGNYSFVAILPNEGISVDDYLSKLTSSKLMFTLRNPQSTNVTVSLPKFSYDYSIVMNDALKKMGMPDAFSLSDADFGKMATSSNGNIYIGEVLQKAYISVDELGTKAGAVTKVEMKDECSFESGKSVVLDRPFLYMIIDTATNLPIFIGKASNLGK